MMKKLGFVLGGAAAGMVLFGGMASATTGHHGWDHDGQVGLLNLNNSSVLHNVNGTAGLCGNSGNVLGVQVPIRNSGNGIGLPLLSPGGHWAGSDQLGNCASGGVVDGGSGQHS